MRQQTLGASQHTLEAAATAQKNNPNSNKQASIQATLQQVHKHSKISYTSVESINKGAIDCTEH